MDRRTTIVAILVALALAVTAWRLPELRRLLGQDLTPAALRCRWAADLDALFRSEAGLPGPDAGEREALTTRYGNLLIDLRTEMAQVTVAGQRYTTPWRLEAHPREAHTLTVVWERRLPLLGERTDFTTLDGQTTILILDVPLPMKVPMAGWEPAEDPVSPRSSAPSPAP